MDEQSNRPGDGPDGAAPARPDGPPATEPPPPPAEPSPPPAPDPPVAQAVPAMAILTADQSAQMEERLRRLEAALRGLEELQRQSGRAPEAGIQPTEGPPPPKGPSFLGRAAAWVGSLAPLAKAVVLDPSPVGEAPRPPRPWFLLDALADARAMVRMYADPRYRLTWMGRIVPPLLLFAFLTVHLWLPYLLPCVGWLLFKIPGLQWVLEKTMELLLAYLLFRALGQEARRYRETAPDLPPSLRL